MTESRPDPTSILDAAVDLLGRSGAHGSIRLRADARSMEPTLRPGQRLAVNFRPSDPRPGDLLLFRQSGELVVHRYLGPARPFEDGRPALRLRGDACWGLDPKVEHGAVVGRVTAVETGQGWRGLDGPAARLYGRAIAAHALCWAAAAGLARRGGPRLLAWVAAADRALLGVAHATLFRAACRLLGQPPAGAL